MRILISIWSLSIEEVVYYIEVPSQAWTNVEMNYTMTILFPDQLYTEADRQGTFTTQQPPHYNHQYANYRRTIEKTIQRYLYYIQTHGT